MKCQKRKSGFASLQHTTSVKHVSTAMQALDESEDIHPGIRQPKLNLQLRPFSMHSQKGMVSLEKYSVHIAHALQKYCV